MLYPGVRSKVRGPSSRYRRRGAETRARGRESRVAITATEGALGGLKIYTRGGDAGETTLLGGDRVAKDDARVAAYGTVDELNACLGVVLALADPAVPCEELSEIQEDLFTIGSRLAASDPDRALRKGTIPQLDEGRISEIEAWIDRMDDELPPLDAFVLPGGSPSAAHLHVARTVCRRAERKVVALLDVQPDLGDVVVPYLNRVSDLLFTLARFANRRSGREDTTWLPQRRQRAGDAAGPA